MCSTNKPYNQKDEKTAFVVHSLSSRSAIGVASCTKKTTITGKVASDVAENSWVYLYDLKTEQYTDSVAPENGAYTLKIKPVKEGKAIYRIAYVVPFWQ